MVLSKNSLSLLFSYAILNLEDRLRPQRQHFQPSSQLGRLPLLAPSCRTLPAYNSFFNDASADVIARFSIWAFLPLEKCGGGPLVDGGHVLKPGEYIEKHKQVVNKWGGKGSRVFKAEAADEYDYR